MNARTTAVGLALLVSVSVIVGAGLAGAQQRSTVSVGSSSVSAGSQASVDVTVDELPDGLQTYEVTISLDDPRVANVTGGRPGDVRGDGFSVVSRSADSITLRGADFEDRVQPGAGSTRLGTVLLNDTYGGTSDISVTVSTMRNDNRSQVNFTTSAGEIEVTGGTPRPTATATPETTTATATPTATDTPEPATTATADATTGAETTDTPTPAEETIPPVTPAATDTVVETAETTASSGPGFTGGVALAALAAVALLAARRRD
jgi:PGF-CTERM protein